MKAPKATSSKTTPLGKRACGPCKACCEVLKIDVPELKKKANVLCPHHTGTGCGIYAARPPVCQHFLCGWRQFEALDDGWRPDLAGVLIVKRGAAEVAKDYRDAPYGLSIAVTGGEAAMTRPGFAEFVLGEIGKGVPVEIRSRSPGTLLNHHLDAQAGALDIEATRASLARIFAMIVAARWKRGPLMLWHLYRLEVERQRALMEKKLNRTI
jgi:hypothetical protein